MASFLENVRAVTEAAIASADQSKADFDSRLVAEQSRQIEELKQQFSREFVKTKIMEAARAGKSRVCLGLYEKVRYERPHWEAEIAFHIMTICRELGIGFELLSGESKSERGTRQYTSEAHLNWLRKT